MYEAKVYWYDRENDEERCNFVFVIADSWSDAISKIHAEFEDSDLDRIDIELLHQRNSGIVYVPEDCLTKLKNENYW